MKNTTTVNKTIHADAHTIDISKCTPEELYRALAGSWKRLTASETKNKPEKTMHIS